MKHFSRVVALGLALCACIAVIAQQPAASQPGTVITVNLIDAGAGEKQPLRYIFVKGAQAEMTLTSNMKARTAMGGREMPGGNIPTLTTRMQTSISDVNASGDAQVDVSFAGPMGGGMKGQAVIDTRGVVKSLKFNLPADAAPGTQQQAESTQQNSTQYFIPFPEEAVGTGAKWQVTQTMVQQGMTVSQTTDYTLTSRDGNVVNLDVAVSQTAAEQDMERPKMPGMKIHLKSHTATGTGTAVVDASGLLPKATRMELKSETIMTLPQVGELTQTMEASTVGSAVHRAPGEGATKDAGSPARK